MLFEPVQGIYDSIGGSKCANIFKIAFALFGNYIEEKM
jgi:hypothetical protein